MSRAPCRERPGANGTHRHPAVKARCASEGRFERHRFRLHVFRRCLPAREYLRFTELWSGWSAPTSQQGKLVELRYFAGLSAQETAEAMGLPLRTVEREWTTAKAWLRAQLAEAEP